MERNGMAWHGMVWYGMVGMDWMHLFMYVCHVMSCDAM